MLTLYTWPESGNSYKVRLLAALLDIHLVERNVDFPAKEHRSESFLALNPRGTIPVLVDADYELTFTDSSSILVYLAGTHTPSSFWSTDVHEQAAIMDWIAFNANWVQGVLSRARGIVSQFFPEAYSGELQAMQEKGRKTLELLEQRLSSHEWLAVGRPTIADVSNFVYVALAPMGDVSLEPYPAVRSWIARVRALPGFIPIKGLDDPDYKRRGE
ncbi:glutathione S-transferase domain-containing protein [Leucosporidium creatinivorum]|uniref:Glutathione S-transferase domain-containing protein n=1 Tax=Leucosporidium creatinivorum TaxID=106004 RepID=A0A1Y2ENQ9_9BASI|nr:glutathione S-transferase domain-containing protein [Leucosporidium creatinivorum]